MTSIRTVAFACVAAALVTLPLTAAAQTGPRNQDTYFTFSQAVELPNKTLPAGTYFFQLMDSDSNRHIVKVMSQDRRELHATLMAIPYYTNDRPSDEPQVRFMETPAGTDGAGTNAVKVWFYPGRTTGHEFIYPRQQAMRIAQRTGEAVLTTKTETAQVSDTVADAELTRVDRSGTDSAVAMNREQATTPAPATPDPAAAPETSRAAQAPAPTPMPERAAPPVSERTPDPATDRAVDTRMTETDRASRRELPNTAGLLPLLALVGLGSLVGSRWLRRSRRS
jgi:hypothetical protein